jgi:predicted ATP-grasp superfamily ATP-dependent carboligase
MKILVFDANQRSALAATRSLGSAGHHVTTADETALTLAGASRWSRRSLAYPPPGRAPGEFLSWAEAQFASGAFDTALPMTEITTDLLVRHRTRWPTLVLPFADIGIIDALSDKVALYERATALRDPAPRSVIVRAVIELERAIAEIGFPAILKPARSRIRHPHGFLETSVLRVSTHQELTAALKTPAFAQPFLYQAVVSGPAQGIFALYDRGTPVTFFAHRRLREKPPAGGISVYCESRAPDDELVAATRRLLDDVHWHGVAMVEFKGGRVMEVNARFWGSLQLAVDAGVDFPRLLIDHAFGNRDVPTSNYRTGKRLRWWLGDLDRLYLVAKERSRYGTRHVLTELARFLTPDPLRTRHEVFRWRDPIPALREASQYLRALRTHSPASQVRGDSSDTPTRAKAPAPTGHKPPN